MHKFTKYVVRGVLRKRALKLLLNPTTPTELAKKMNTDRPSVSRSILFLCGKKLVRCLNPDDKRGRLYQTTSEGRKVLADLKRMQ